METKGEYTFPPMQCHLRSLYVLKVRKRIVCSVIENQQYVKVSGWQMMPHAPLLILAAWSQNETCIKSSK